MSEYRVTGTADRKYVRELLRHLPKGFQIGHIEEASDGSRRTRRITGKHPGVLTPDGEILRHHGCPVTVCGTPGGRRSLQNDLAAIRRAIDA